MSETGPKRATQAQIERNTRNQILFREVNNRVLDVADHFNAEDTGDFLCECSDLECAETVPLTAEEYRSIRAEPTHFITSPGHLEPTVDKVVGRHDRFWIVETLPGEPTQLAEESA
jgi:hypothetical protein